MQQPVGSLPQFLRGIKIIHLAMVLGLVLSMGILKFHIGITSSGGDMLFVYIASGVAVLSLLFGYTIYNKKIVLIKEKKRTPEEKLSMYREAFMFKMVTIEGPALIAMILHFLGGNPILFYLFLILAAILALQRPTKENVKEAANLSSQEVAELANR